MDVYIVRTRLQALIAKKIVNNYGFDYSYICVFCFQNSTNEDAKEVYELYRSLASEAFCSVNVVSSKGFFENFVKFLALNILVFFTRGKVCLAAIDNYPLSLSLRLFPFVELNTFDDGSANLLSSSKYYTVKSLKGKSLKRKLIRFFFPNGSAKWMREYSKKHYTIFSGWPNILEKENLIFLDWKWESLLIKEDVDKLPPCTDVVVLGTPHQDRNNPYYTQNKAINLLKDVDCYIMHPREELWVESLKMIRLSSPAESVLCFLSLNKKITVYHFNSTVAYSLNNHSNIKFIDVV